DTSLYHVPLLSTSFLCSIIRAPPTFTTLSLLPLPAALPISSYASSGASRRRPARRRCASVGRSARGSAASRSAPRSRTAAARARSEEHTSELQSHLNIVCRLLLEKKKILK